MPRDLERIEDYVLSYSADSDYAARGVDGIIAEFDRVCTRPFLHAVYSFPAGFEPRRGYRNVNVDRYKVSYRIDEEARTVLVYRVLHVASDFTTSVF